MSFHSFSVSSLATGFFLLAELKVASLYLPVYVRWFALCIYKGIQSILSITQISIADFSKSNFLPPSLNYSSLSVHKRDKERVGPRHSIKARALIARLGKGGREKPSIVMEGQDLQKTGQT